MSSNGEIVEARQSVKRRLFCDQKEGLEHLLLVLIGVVSICPVGVLGARRSLTAAAWMPPVTES